MDSKLAEWIEAGIILLPTVSKTELPRSPVRLEEGAAARLLDKDRGELDR